MNKPRVAICFSGHLRYAEEGVKYWKTIVEKYDADVYASFWNMNDDIEKIIESNKDDKEMNYYYTKDVVVSGT